MSRYRNSLYSDLAQRAYNVKDFGAVGNGTRDDTTAFINALSAIASGGTLYVPQGTYLVQLNQLKISANPARIALVGPETVHGYDGTTLVHAKLISANPTSNDVLLDLSNATNVVIKNVGFQPQTPVADGSVGAGKAINATSSNQILIDHCSIDSWGTGIYMDACGVSEITSNNISRCNNGIYATNCGDNIFGDNYINTNYKGYTTNSEFNGIGLFLDNCGNSKIHGGKVEWNGKGIYVFNSQGITISDISFDTNTQWDIAIKSYEGIASPFGVNQGAAKSISVTGCRFLGGCTTGDFANYFTSGANIDIYRASFVTIAGNTFAEGGPDGYDNNLANNGLSLGPTVAFVKVMESCHVVVSGNSFNSQTGISPCAIMDLDNMLKTQVLFSDNETQYAPTTADFPTTATVNPWMFYRRNSYGQREFWSTTQPGTYGTFDVNDIVYNPTSPGHGWLCTTAGSFGTLKGNGGSYSGTTSGTNNLITGVAALDYSLHIGMYITIAGVTGVYKVVGIRCRNGQTPSELTILVDRNITTAVSGAAIALSAPAFTAF